MKKVIFVIFCFNVLRLYSQSNITYDATTNMDISAGADVCADAVIINGSYSGTGTICQGVLPVTMLSFNSTVYRNTAGLTWITGSEINNSGFDIYRKIDKDGALWQKVAFIQGSGTTNHQKSYAYLDKNLHTGKYQYRLKQIDYNGNFEYFNLENVVDILKPKDFKVSQNYPNPSNPKSKIDYEIPISGKVSIKIYDIIGREAVTIVNETKEAGYYSAEFDGSNMASGVYIYRVLAEGDGLRYSKILKMILVK